MIYLPPDHPGIPAAIALFIRVHRDGDFQGWKHTGFGQTMTIRDTLYRAWTSIFHKRRTTRLNLSGDGWTFAFDVMDPDDRTITFEEMDRWRHAVNINGLAVVRFYVDDLDAFMKAMTLIKLFDEIEHDLKTFEKPPFWADPNKGPAYPTGKVPFWEWHRLW